MEAELSVESTPENRAERATRETSPARDGAIWDSTPICVPREPKLPKPVANKHTYQSGDHSSEVRTLKKGAKLTAESICGDQFGPWAHVDVLLFTGQRGEGDEFVGDDFDADQLADLEQVVSRNTEKEGHGVADVAEEDLEGQIRFAIFGDVDISEKKANVWSVSWRFDGGISAESDRLTFPTTPKDH